MHSALFNHSGPHLSNSVETGADPEGEVTLCQVARVIHETFISRQSRRTNNRMLINVVAENNRNLNTTPLYIHALEGLPLELTTQRCRNRARRETSQTTKSRP